MRFYSRRMIIALLCTFVSGVVDAELVVIYDSGRTRPIDEFLGPLTKSRSTDNQQIPSPALLGAANPKNILPIRSPDLTPGNVENRKHSFRFAQAFFLIGSDTRSQHWLQRHRARLLKLGAVGLLVQAESIEDLETIAEISAGLPITPASGSDVAKALGETHYPFAISDGRIWQ